MSTFALNLSGLLGFAFFANIPLGYLRQRTLRFSWQWFFYIHASIPLIILLRLWLDFSWKWIPLTIACAVLGQIAGGRLLRRLQR
ncbi:MAG: hypothetical protein Q7U44_08240 [Desulfuromonadales bacterium]|nr:hypothetical protein [Desulfuromonadales bacterium]